MDVARLDRQFLLKSFDRLRSEGTLLWTQPTAKLSFVEDGFPFEFLVCPSQVTKPAFPEQNGTESTNTIRTANNTLISSDEALNKSIQNGTHKKPESDIDNGEPGYHIANVCDTHRLIFNKFCIYRPQYILLTQDPLEKQTTPLGVSDFRAAWTVLQNLEGKHFVIFNCGRAAGGSRMHKHLQVFEQPHAEILPDLLLKPENSIKPPYEHYLTRLDDVGMSTDASIASETLAKVYEEHLSHFAATDDSGEAKSHNVILTDRWLMTIPRRKAGLDRATANAAGFIGLVWVPSDDVVRLWKELGPLHVLSELGVASQTLNNFN